MVLLLNCSESAAFISEWRKINIRYIFLFKLYFRLEDDTRYSMICCCDLFLDEVVVQNMYMQPTSSRRNFSLTVNIDPGIVLGSSL